MAQTTAASVSRTLANHYRRSESYATMIRGANSTSEGYTARSINGKIYVEWVFGNDGIKWATNNGKTYNEIRLEMLNGMASILIKKGYEISMHLSDRESLRVTAKH
jgi:hypothetical protein